MHVSLITATVPCLRPFIAPFEADHEDDTQSNNNITRTISRSGSSRAKSTTSVPGFMFRKPSTSLQIIERGGSVVHYNSEEEYRLGRSMSRQSVQDSQRKRSKDMNTAKQPCPQKQHEWMRALANPGAANQLMTGSGVLGFEVTVDSGSPIQESPVSPAETRVGNSLVTIVDEEEEDDMFIRRVKEVSVEYSHSNSV